LGTPYYRGGLSPERCPYGYVAVAPNGTFAVGDAYGSYVRYFTSSGSLTDTWNLATGREDIYEETRGLFLNGLAFAPSGNVFVTDIRFDRLRCFTATGSFLGAIGERPAKDAAGGDVVDLTVGPEGDLYVCHGYDDVVARYSPSGEVMAAWGGTTHSWLSEGPPEPGLFDFPCAIAVAADGTVYVVDRDNNRVQYFRPRAAGGED